MKLTFHICDTILIDYHYNYYFLNIIILIRICSQYLSESSPKDFTLS